LLYDLKEASASFFVSGLIHPPRLFSCFSARLTPLEFWPEPSLAERQFFRETGKELLPLVKLK
jgi:hypothetical protein